ncbi:MAG: sigma-54 dependent transcriptional regulator [Desulfobacterales bacterium]|nr:sigma-54 dependent transcriptional regulator [Desulfobacterales bacterium]
MDQGQGRATILIVDDDPVFCSMLEDLVGQMGHVVRTADCLDACREELGRGELDRKQVDLKESDQDRIDLVLLDVGLPDGSGLNALPWIRQMSPAPEVIIITGEGDADGAELAVHNGAWDYLIKTSPLERIRLTIIRALEHHRATLALRALKSIDPCGIVGHSPALQRCLDLMGQAARNDFNVLITGETGTGKELFARAIHANSQRAAGRLVVVDCASLPKNLVESVLFGHIRGAFTGADKDADGLFRDADGGTLFMDEVGELPMDLQRIFLRVLQEKSFRPVGADREIPSNFRLIAATNKDLEGLVAQGKFREDLLFRLRALSLHLPPLRERPEDLPLLTDHILQTISGTPPELSGEFTQALAAHDWPGNIRELTHVLQGAAAVAMGSGPLIVQHLPPGLRAMVARRRLDYDIQGLPVSGHWTGDDPSPDLSIDSSNDDALTGIREFRQARDKEYLERLVKAFQGDMQGAAQKAGLSLSRLYSLLREHGLK